MDRRIKSACVAVLVAAVMSIVSGCSDIQFLDDLKEIAGLGSGSIHIMGGSMEISNGGSFTVGGIIAPDVMPGTPYTFRIENKGIKDLNNVFVTLDPALNFFEYQINLSPNSFIPPGSSSDVIISFFPQSGGYRSLPVYVSSSDPDGTFTFYIGGSIPGWTGYTPLPPVANDVAVAGNYAYIAADSAGIAVCDISNKENPKLINIIPITDSGVNTVEISGDYLLAGTIPIASPSPLPDNFHVYRLTGNPGAPQLTGSVNTGSSNMAIIDIAANGLFAYVCTSSDNFYTISINAFGVPSVQGTYVNAPGTYGTGLAVYENTAYVSYSDGTSSNLVFINIPFEEPPTLQGSEPLETIGKKVALFGSIIYLTAENRDLEYMDAKNPSTTDTTIGSTTGNAILVSYPHVFTSSLAGRINAFNITEPVSPYLDTFLPQPVVDGSIITGLARSGEYIIATTVVGYLHVFLLPPGY